MKALNGADGNNLQRRMEMCNQPQSEERITSKDDKNINFQWGKISPVTMQWLVWASHSKDKPREVIFF